MREILLYTSIYDWSAGNFITMLDAAKGEDIAVRINTNGGSPEAAFGMIAKMAERKSMKKNTKVKVDGKAHSMGAFLLAYADEVEALDVSEILIHRAAYPDWIERDPEYMTENMWASLNRTNAKLRTALESRVDTMKFTAVTGKTLDQIFSTSDRIDVILTAEQAKTIGLVDKVVQITPERRADVSRVYAMAAMSGTELLELPEAVRSAECGERQDNNEQTENNDTMTLAELKSKHPNLVTELLAEERDRVESFLVFADVDLKLVTEGIASGKPMTAKMSAELTRKQLSAEFLAKAEEGSAAEVTTTEAPKTPGAEAAKKKEEDAFWSEVDANLGLKK